MSSAQLNPKVRMTGSPKYNSCSRSWELSRSSTNWPVNRNTNHYQSWEKSSWLFAEQSAIEDKGRKRVGLSFLFGSLSLETTLALPRSCLVISRATTSSAQWTEEEWSGVFLALKGASCQPVSTAAALLRVYVHRAVENKRHGRETWTSRAHANMSSTRCLLLLLWNDYFPTNCDIPGFFLPVYHKQYYIAHPYCTCMLVFPLWPIHFILG